MINRFLLIWIGQLGSRIGSGLTNFALGVWVYQESSSVTQLGMTFLFASLPQVLISPIAGAIVDRHPRKHVMLIADTVSGVATLFLFLLFLAGRLDIWLICALTAINATANAFQWPAYTALTTTIVPERHLSRASGLNELGDGLSQLVAPVLGGVLVVGAGLEAVFLVDAVTFVFAVFTVLCVRVEEVAPQRRSVALATFFQEIREGIRFLEDRPGLLHLLLFFAASNLLTGSVQVLATPLVLSIATPAELGMVLSIGGVGMLAGSLTLIVFAFERRRIAVISAMSALGGACIFAAGCSSSVAVMMISAFAFFFGVPIIYGSCQVLLQLKVELALQGRIFALQGAIGAACMPIAFVLVGPLADGIFEPMMARDGVLAGSIGRALGAGPGRGIGLMLILIGMALVVLSLVTGRARSVRALESERPSS